MNGVIPEAYSKLASILARRNLSVPALQRTLGKVGVPVNIKSLYRLAEDAPLQKIDLRIAAAICKVCAVPFAELISFEKPQAQLHRLSAKAQARLDTLMARNNEGRLTAAEREEFLVLAEQAHQFSLANARLLLAGRRRAGQKATARPTPGKPLRARKR